MSVCRVNKKAKSGFTQLDNTLINDTRLSFQTLGVLTYLLSKPHNWQVRMSELAGKRKEGREAIRNTMKELENAGYMHRERVRGPAGKMAGWVYEIFEEPSSPSDGKPSVGSPTVGQPTVGKAPPTKKESTKKESTKSRFKKHPLPFASEGDHSSFASSAPKDPPDNPVDDVPPDPPEDEALPVNSGTVFPDTRRLPKQGNHADYIQAVSIHDAPAAAKLASLYPGFTWDRKTARKYVSSRRDGELTDKVINLLSRFLRDTPFPPETAFPPSLKHLLQNLDTILPVVRGWASQMLSIAADDLASVKTGDPEFTISNYNRALRWLRENYKPADDPAVVLAATPAGVLWAVRLIYAQKDIYPEVPEKHEALLTREVQLDPLIGVFITEKGFSPLKVLGMDVEKIKAINAALVAELQARVDDIQIML